MTIPQNPRGAGPDGPADPSGWYDVEFALAEAAERRRNRLTARLWRCVAVTLLVLIGIAVVAGVMLHSPVVAVLCVPAAVAAAVADARARRAGRRAAP